MPRQRVGDIEIYYEVHGTGPRTLVLIRGLGSNLLAWYAQIDVFSQHYKCVVFDNRGAGRTDKPDAPYSIKQMADDAAGLMDALGIRRAALLGISMGGMIAQEFAINHQEKLSCLILGCTHFGGKDIVATPPENLAAIVAGSNATPQQQKQVLQAVFCDDTIEHHPEVVEKDNRIRAQYAIPPFAFARQVAAARSLRCECASRSDSRSDDGDDRARGSPRHAAECQADCRSNSGRDAQGAPGRSFVHVGVSGAVQSRGDRFHRRALDLEVSPSLGACPASIDARHRARAAAIRFVLCSDAGETPRPRVSRRLCIRRIQNEFRRAPRSHAQDRIQMPALGAFHINGFIFEHQNFSGANSRRYRRQPKSHGMCTTTPRWTRKTRARRNSLCHCLHHSWELRRSRALPKSIRAGRWPMPPRSTILCRATWTRATRSNFLAHPMFPVCIEWPVVVAWASASRRRHAS